MAGKKITCIVLNLALCLVVGCKTKSDSSDDCDSTNPGLTSGSQPAATPPPVCTQDGQIDCLTTAAFPAADVGIITTWDLRSGSQVAGVSGSMRYGCRNATAALWDNTTAPAGAGLDIYDTIDDYNNDVAYPTVFPNAWDAHFYCDSSLFDDQSTNSSGEPTTCSEVTDDCVIFDRVSKLYWSEENPGNSNWSIDDVIAGNWPCGDADCDDNEDGHANNPGTDVYADAAQLYWWDTIYACDQLDFAGNSDWRLPTQKEIMQAYVHGITDLHDPGNFADLTNVYWSSTTDSWGGGVEDAWDVGIAFGDVADRDKESLRSFMCVRP